MSREALPSRSERECDREIKASWTSGSGYVPPNCHYCGKPVLGGQDRTSFVDMCGVRVYAHAALCTSAEPSAGVDSVAPNSGTGATANRPAPGHQEMESR